MSETEAFKRAFDPSREIRKRENEHGGGNDRGSPLLHRVVEVDTKVAFEYPAKDEL